MPQTDLLFPMLAIAFCAGMVQGLSGFGSALVAVPLMALLLPIETVVPLMTLLALVISGFNLWHLRHEARLSPVKRLLAGYVLGTPLGLLFLTQAPKDLVLGALGLFISLYAGFALSGRQPRAAWLREARVGLGMTSGALGAAFSTNGPPVLLHVAAHPEWSADRQKGTLVVYFLGSGLITMSAHTVTGLITGEVLTWLLWVSPTLLLGTQTGTVIYRRLGDHHYKRLTFLLILTTGMVLFGRSMAG